MKSFKSIFPFNQTEIAAYSIMNDAEIDQVLKHSENAFAGWSNTTFNERAAILKKVADLLLAKKEMLAKLITSEMGKVLKESIAEVEKCALGCNYYADNAEQFLQDEIIHTKYKKSFVAFQPIG